MTLNQEEIDVLTEYYEEKQKDLQILIEEIKRISIETTSWLWDDWQDTIENYTAQILAAQKRIRYVSNDSVSL